MGAACITVGLFVRRFFKIRESLERWRKLVLACGLATHPPSFFRVAITGVTTGIGHELVRLLRPFPSVEIITCGRSLNSPEDIYVDLSDRLSVSNCATKLGRRWYEEKPVNPFGQDIFINNAGVFTSMNASLVWRTNLWASVSLTESVADSFANSNTSRALRFVQLGSRLESESLLSIDNVESLYKSKIGASSYSDTKRGLLEHTCYMSTKYEKNKGLSFCVVTPGMVNTELGKKSAGSILWYLSWPLRYMFTRHSIEGAVTVLWAALGCTDNGVYLGDHKILERISHTRNMHVGEKLSSISWSY